MSNIEETLIDDDKVIDSNTEEIEIQQQDIDEGQDIAESPDIENQDIAESPDIESEQIETIEGEEYTETLQTDITPTGMSVAFMGLSAVQCIVAVLIIFIVLRQSKTAIPMASGVLSGVNSDTESYWNKNKGRSQEGQLAKLTVILAVIFFIVTFLLGFIK